MTMFFSDTFAGSGSLAGHAPETGYGTLKWSNTVGTTTLSGGYAVNTATYDSGTKAVYFNGSYSLPSEVHATLVWYSGAYVTTPDASGHIGISFDLGADGEGVSANLEAVPGASGWQLRLKYGTTEVTTAVPGGALAANTEYTGNIYWSLTGLTFEMFGVSCYLALERTVSTGLEYLRMLLGGTRKIASLVIDTDMPSAPTGSTGLLALSTLLSAPSLLAFNDFSGQLGDATSVYVADLITPTGTVRVPISSWQATLRTGAASYVQAVIPACAPWVTDINAATQLVISRRAILPNGSALDYEMARTPLESIQFDLGPRRYTCTISGYTTAFAVVESPDATYDRYLNGVRSDSSNGSSGRRVRCAVDWLLRPGQRAWVNGTSFVVGFINYYSPPGWDSYMDVGEQA